MGIDQWPGWMTFVGAAIVMLAINVMYQGEVRRSEDLDDIKEVSVNKIKADAIKESSEIDA